MIAETVVTFSAADVPWQAISQALRSVGREDAAAAGPAPWGLYDVTFLEDQEGPARLAAALESLGIKSTLRIVEHFSPSEATNFPLLLTWPHSAGRSGPAAGTKYDLSNACRLCGTGARALPPVHVVFDQPDNEAVLVQTEDGDFLIGEHAVRGLDLNGELADTVVAGNMDTTWLALVDLPRMPSMSKKSQGVLREDPCAECSTDGYFFDLRTPPRVVYEKIRLDDIPPLAFTSEHFGNSRLAERFEESYFAPPMLVMTPESYITLRSQGASDLRYVPIVLKDV